MFSVADFTAGNVTVTLYSGGLPLSKAQVQYYSNVQEITTLLARAANPVDFMCQVKLLKGLFQMQLSVRAANKCVLLSCTVGNAGGF